MLFFCFIISLLCTSNLKADGDFSIHRHEKSMSCLADGGNSGDPPRYDSNHQLMVGPDTVVANCVNAVTGAFFDVETDLEELGTPLKLNRCYCSAQPMLKAASQGINEECPIPCQPTDMLRCWSWNHATILGWRTYCEELYVGNVEWGILEVFTTKGPKGRKEGKIHQDQFRGWTNTTAGMLGARFDSHNQRLKDGEEGKFWTITTANGTQRLFRGNCNKKIGNKEWQYWCTHEDQRNLPNGLIYQYEHGNLFQLKRVELLDRFSKCRLGYIEKIGETSYVDERGNRVDYELRDYICQIDYRGKNDEKNDYTGVPIKVVRSHAPTIEYEYSQFVHGVLYSFYNHIKNRYEKFIINYNSKPFLTCKQLPEGRYLKIDYLDGFPKYWFNKNNLKSSGMSPHAGKVTRLIVPKGIGKGIPGGSAQGEGVEEIVRYSFTYNEGMTQVTDACGGVQEFYFDNEKRLEKVVSRGADEILTRFYRWGKGVDEGRLVQQWASDGKGKTLFCRCFEYDKRGNVISETMHGDFKGNGGILVVDNKGKIVKSLDVVLTTYDYSDNEYNLLLREVHSDGRTVDYIYEAGSSRMSARLESVEGNIFKRIFQFYDRFANCSMSIEDDGRSKDPYDLIGVHKRLISRQTAYEEGPSMGLIREDVRSYWDSQSEQERILTTTRFSYHNSRLLKERLIKTEGCNVLTRSYFEYDTYGHLVREELPNGAVIVREYDANGNLIREQGPDSRCVSYFEYDLTNQLISKREVHPDVQLITRYQYDAMGRLTQEQTPYGSLRKLTYDGLGRPVSQQLPVSMLEEAIERYDYDSFGRMVRKIDALGYVEQFVYNCCGALVEERKQGQVAKRHFYDLRGFRAKTQMATGSYETYRYDSLGRLCLLERFNSEGQMTFSQTYGYKGLLLSVIKDSTGRLESHDYDGAGRMVRKTISDEIGAWQLEEWEYDGQGRVVRERRFANPDEYIDYCFSYNESGRLCATYQETNEGVRLGWECFEWDEAGRETLHIKSCDGKEEKKQTCYDSHGNPLSVIDAMGAMWSYQYDYCVEWPGNSYSIYRILEMSPGGIRKLQFCNEHQLPIEVTIYGHDQRVAYHAKYSYDAYKGCTLRKEMRLVDGQEKPEIIVTRIAFGPSRQVIERCDAAGSKHERITRWIYDESGHLVNVQLPSSTQIHYSYDCFGMLRNVVSSDHTVNQLWAHDVYGNPTSVIQGNGISTFRLYNACNQVVCEQLSSGHVIQKSYDGLGRLITLQLPGGIEVERNYKGILLRSILLKGELGKYEHRYLEYDNEGRVLQEQMVGNVGHLLRSYDGLGRPVGLESRYFSSQVDGFDSMGRVASIREGFGKTLVRFLKYDPLGQLVSEISEVRASNYLYSSRQERIAKDQEFYVHDLVGQLVSGKGGEFQEAEYDLDGRLTRFRTRREEFFLAYDALGQLTELTTRSGAHYQYLYDGFSRRIGKRWSTGCEADEEFYIYDDQFEMGSLSGNKWKEFRLIGARSRAETGDTLLIFLEGHPYVPISDLQGSIVGWIDSNTLQLTAHCSYDPYGIAEGKILGPWGYVSKRIDLETGWIFFGKRYYIPHLGCWATQDSRGEIDGSNLYAFLRNNPIHQWDLWGYSSCSGLNRSIGVVEPLCVNLTAMDVSNFQRPLEDVSHRFENIYGRQFFNSCFIMVMVDSRAPFKGFSNGIGNSRQECVGRCVRMAIESKVNVLSVYNASMGLLSDVISVVYRNSEGFDPMRAEYEMTGYMYSLGLDFNEKTIGLRRFHHLAHSNGEQVSLRATKYLRLQSDIDNLYITSISGVGNYLDAHENFKYHKCYIHRGDRLAHIARSNIPNDRVIPLNCYSPYRAAWNVHAIDIGVNFDVFKNHFCLPYSELHCNF